MLASTLLKAENKETLRLYEQGQTEAALGAVLGVSRSAVKHRLDKFREAGILQGSWGSLSESEPVVDWAKLEALAGGAKLVVLPSSTTPRPVAPLPSLDPSAEFSAKEVRALKRLAAQESEMVTKIKDTGEKVLVNVRADSGLWSAVKEQAKEEGISAARLVDRALRQYLGAE